MRARLPMVVGTAALVSTLAGCAGAMGYQPPVGGVYAGAKGINPMTQAEVSDGVRPGPKTGQACTQGVLALASWGDMSLEAAKKNGGITRVDTLDYKTMDILGVIYQKHCTIITGE
jgi:TRL-like protein family